MQTIKSFEITVQSAWSALQILDRQARRDTGKVIRTSYRTYLWLSNSEMKHRYRRFMEMSRRIAELFWLVALAIGADLQQLIEAYVEACQEQPVAAVVEAVEIVEVAEPTQDNQPGITDAVVPFVRPAQPEATSESVTIDWSILSPYDLRKACQEQGIKWRSVHGKNKHLSKLEMIAALTQGAAQVA